MRCRHCQYELWSQRPGPCPECGEPFSPRNAVFRKYSAHFCCPHCDERYWGNGKDGLPEPAEFQCANCGGAVRLEEMVMRPAPGLEQVDTQWDLHPFDNSADGLLRRVWRTSQMATSDPYRLGRSLVAQPSVKRALSFVAFIVGVVGSIAILPALGMMAYAVIVSGSLGAARLDIDDFGWAVVGWGLGTVIGLAVLLSIVASLEYLCLCCMHQRPASASRFVCCVCYACGPLVLCGVPCAGACVAPMLFVLGVRSMSQQFAGAGFCSDKQAMWIALLTAGVVAVLVVGGLFIALQNL